MIFVSPESSMLFCWYAEEVISVARVARWTEFRSLLKTGRESCDKYDRLVDGPAHSARGQTIMVIHTLFSVESGG